MLVREGEATDRVVSVPTRMLPARSAPARVVEDPRMLGGPSVVDALNAMVTDLGRLDDGCDDAERIDRIAALERVQAAAAAAQAHEITLFAESQEAEQRRRSVSARRLGQGVAEQVALARKVSPVTGAHQVGFARALTRRMPHTFALLATGEISAWVATLMVRETAVLSTDHRRQVDDMLAGDLASWSPREVEAAARRAGIGLDPASAIRRGRTARADRRVSIRPAPDTMALVTGFVPCEQGIAAWASLDRDARAKRGHGDPRSIAAIMADTFVERLTGQPTAAAVPVEIGITMPFGSLLTGDDDVAASLAHYGPIPAALARHIAGVRPDDRLQPRQPDQEARVFMRRIFTDPAGDRVLHVDPARRLFPPALARLFGYETKSAESRTAPPRSATTTTRSPTATVDLPLPTTARDCANATHTSKRCPDGTSKFRPAPHTAPSSPPQPATRTSRPHHQRSVPAQTTPPAPRSGPIGDWRI